MTGSVLVIGYGNALRSDDGVGPAVAAALSCDVRAFGLTVLQRHQLTPELAPDLAAASRVILIDAEAPVADGEVEMSRERETDPSRIAVRAIEPASADHAASSHHLDPATLLALANELYGSAPRTYLISVRGECFEAGDELTNDVQAAVPLAVEATLRLCGSLGDA
jgi:hydrogenase maturation protease